MAGSVEFGVYNIAGNPNLTFITFMGVTLLSVLGLRFGFYAHRNRRNTEIETQRPVWRFLTYAGLLAFVYGLLTLLEIVSSVTTPYRSGVMLALTLALTLTIRQIHVTAGEEGAVSVSEFLVRLALYVAVVGVVAGLVVLGASPALAAVEGVTALVAVAYGGVYYHDQTTHTRLQGTMIDSLLRHLLPVLTFASLASIVKIAEPFGLSRVVVLHVQVVFVIMTATALMTATIKLRQNLASL